MNDKLYIHEFIDITKQNRSKYMYHMTANWSPIAQEERDQKCFGVWGVVGTTKRWPEVVNLWEEDGIDGQTSSFRHEFNHSGLQDPKLAKWWAGAADLRSSGTDRLIKPAPWTRTINELTEAGVRGEVYAHDMINVPAGSAPDYLEFVREEVIDVHAEFGWELAGAWRTIMVDDSEVFLIWAIPQWEDWAAFEHAHDTHDKVVAMRAASRKRSDSFYRFLMCDAPTSPFNLGRQPSREDRTEDYTE